MNTLLSVHAAHQEKRNIYNDVKNFQKQEYHYENFVEVMQ